MILERSQGQGEIYIMEMQICKQKWGGNEYYPGMTMLLSNLVVYPNACPDFRPTFLSITAKGQKPVNED